MNGRGAEFLKKVLISLTTQTYKQFEVVISDHSISNQIEYCVKEYPELDIKYIHNNHKRGSSSANINVAISNAKYDIIKPIFQDDFICSQQCLEHIAQANGSWGASQFIHTDEQHTKVFNPMNPVMTNRTVHGVNTFGCPSVMFFKKGPNTYFDEKLIWLMDCEFYHRLWKLYGNPTIISSIDVCVRVWGDSVSGHVSEQTKSEEYEYVKGKHAL